MRGRGVVGEEAWRRKGTSLVPRRPLLASGRDAVKRWSVSRGRGWWVGWGVGEEWVGVRVWGGGAY